MKEIFIYRKKTAQNTSLNALSFMLTATVLLFGAFFCISVLSEEDCAAPRPTDDFYFRIIPSSDNAVITGIVDTSKKTIEIPNKVYYNLKEYSVIAIDPFAFYGNKYVEEVTIPENVDVGYDAFSYCSSLKKINYGETNRFERAFVGCNFDTVMIYDSMDIDVLYYFDGATTKQITLQEGSTKFVLKDGNLYYLYENYKTATLVFYQKSNIETLTIPDVIKKGEEEYKVDAIHLQPNDTIKTLVLGENVETIANLAYLKNITNVSGNQYCKNEGNILYYENNTYNTTDLIAILPSSDKEVTLNFKNIPLEAFSTAKNIEKVTFGANVEDILPCNNNELKNNIKEFVVIGNPIYYTENGILFKYDEYNDAYSLFSYPQGKTDVQYTIPNTINGKEVIEIGDCSFSNSKLKKLIFGEKTTSFRTNALYNSEIVYLDLKNIEYISGNAFTGATKLTEIVCDNERYVSIDGALYELEKGVPFYLLK